MQIARQVVLLVALLVADAWLVSTLYNAIFVYPLDTAVFWTSVGVIAVLAAALIWWTVRVARRFASRFAKPPRC